MKLRTALLLLAVLSLFLLTQVFNQPDDKDAPALLPGLATSRDAVQRVLVTGLDEAGGQLSIITDDSGWILQEKSGYPVDFEGFIAFLDAVVEAKLTEQKTAKESFHPRLGLAASGAPGEAGTQIDIYAGDETFSFIKGIESAAQTGTFIRYPDDNQVWLTDQTFAVSVDPLDWINPVAINLDAERVMGVEMIRDGKVQLVAAREGISLEGQAEGSLEEWADGSLEEKAEGSQEEQAEGSLEGQADGSQEEQQGELILQGQPPGTELKYPTIVSGLARMLVNLRFEDVSRYDPGQWQDYGIARVQLDSGVSIEARTRTQEDKFLLHLQVTNNSDTESDAESETENYADLKNWQFEISEYVFKELNKTTADMLKEDVSE